jgi:hypothetical protein
MQDAARDEYAHAICIFGEIAPSGYGWSLHDRVCLGIGTARVPQPGTNIESEGRRGILFQSFLAQDAARDEYAHALGTLRSMPASRKPRYNENDGSGMT